LAPDAALHMCGCLLGLRRHRRRTPNVSSLRSSFPSFLPPPGRWSSPVSPSRLGSGFRMNLGPPWGFPCPSPLLTLSTLSSPLVVVSSSFPQLDPSSNHWGFCLLLQGSLLNDCVFKFSVASKEVGLIVHHLISFECPLFKLYFHLWGGGGLDWRTEYKLFLEEERSS